MGPRGARCRPVPAPLQWRKTRAKGPDMEKLEEQIAHLTRAVDDLSDIVTRQEDEITHLNRRVHMLMQREGEREASTGGAVVMGDERPPHY